MAKYYNNRLNSGVSNKNKIDQKNVTKVFGKMAVRCQHTQKSGLTVISVMQHKQVTSSGLFGRNVSK